MLFKRRDKQHILKKLRNTIWPEAGWKRSFLYIKHRLIRLPHSTHDIAMGLTAGCVVSWTPTWGIQILQCFVFCKITRANFLAALLGTTFGNPWTFPILIWIAHLVGQGFIDLTGLDSLFDLIGGPTVLPDESGFGITAFIPTLIGGYIMAVITFPIFYYSFYYFLTGARAAQHKVKNKVHDIAEKVHDRKEHRHEKKTEKNQ